MSLFSLMATLGLDSSGYEQGLDDAERKGSTFGSKIKAGLGTAAKIGAAAIGVASAAVVKFGSDSVKVGQEFDSSMSQIAATLGLSSKDIQDNINGAGDTFQALRDKAQEMGAATNFSASQAAEGLNILAMSGYSATDSISMIEDVLHLAAAGSMDMASAAGFISGAMKGFNDESKSSAYYANLMAKGATLANTSVTQLGEAMSSGAAGAAAYSQDAESMTVALLRLAEQGEVGAAAGTSLSAAMKNLYTPTDQAKSALEELGVAAYDSNGKARDFNTVVNELDSALSGYTEEQKNAYKQTIFGIQGLNAYNKMTVTGVKRQNEWADALAGASEGAGEAAKQYETMTDNLQGDVDIWNSALDGFKIAVSDKLMPTVREFVQFGSTGLSKITEGFKNGGLAGAMDAFGEVLSDGLAMIVQKIPEMVDAGLKLVKALGKGLVDNTPLLVQTALDIVLMLGQYLSENTDALFDAAVQIITSLMDWIGEYSGQLISTAVEIIIKLVEGLTNPESISQIIQSAVTLIEYLVEGLIQAVPQLIAAIPVIIENLVTAISENLPVILQAGMDILTMLIQGITDNIPLVVESIMSVISTITTFITENLPEILEMGIELLTSLMNGLIGALPILLENLPQLIDTIVNFIMENLPLIIQMGITLVSRLAEGLIQNLPAIIQATLTLVNAILNYIIQHLPEIIQMGIRLVSTLVQGLLKNMPALIQAAMQLISGLLNGIIKNLPQIIAMGIQLVGQLIVGLIRAIPQIIAALPQIFRAIIDGFKSVNWGDIGRSIIDGIKNGIINFASNLWNAAKDAVNGAIQGVKNFLGIHSPSRVFRDQVGKMIGLGLAEGIEDSAYNAVDAAEQMAKDVVSEMSPLNDFNGDFSGVVDSMENTSGAGLESNRSVVINVYGAEGQNVGELAEIISQKIAFGYRQEQMAWA